MVETKPIEDVVSKWKNRAAMSEPEYRKGVGRAKDWQGKTQAAETRYEQGVQAAISDKRFGKGVADTSTEEWRAKATAKGAPRWAPGVAAAEGDFRSGMSENLATIQSVTLPERGPAGSAGNYERVRAVGEALHKQKVGG